jgi:D-alanine-D-alanine ligase
MPLSIGLTYDLKDDYLAAGFSPEQVMEFDSEDTVVGLEDALRALGHTTMRIGRGRELARRLVAGERWDLVFNIAEGVWGRSREAQVPALCELYDQPYTFADPLTCALTLDKALAKRVVRDHGLATAPFAVVGSAEEAERVELPAPLFVKPVAEGSSKGVTGRSLVRERGELAGVCRELIARFGQPVLVETFLPGREVTVGVLGNGSDARVVGILEVGFTDKAEVTAYTALNKKEFEERVSYRLVDPGDALHREAGALAVAVFGALGCRDVARVDVRCDGRGVPCFLEVNPLPGLNHVISDLPMMARLGGTDFRTLIGEIVAAAAARLGIE